MFWVFLLGCFGAAAVYANRERHRELIPYVVAVIASVEMFFIFLMVIHKNPFSTFLTPAPADGAGLNPLLQNLQASIRHRSTSARREDDPLAFGRALITGFWTTHGCALSGADDGGWMFLTFGLGLGCCGPTSTGWGGYWGWYPVRTPPLPCSLRGVLLCDGQERADAARLDRRW